MNKFEQKREQRKDQVMEVALNLFSEVGYEKTTIRQIAQEAGMAMGLLYNYYSGKEELLTAIFLNEQKKIKELWIAATEDNKGDKLGNFIRSTVKMVKQNPKFWRLWFGLRLQSPIFRQLEETLKEETELIHKRVEEYLNEAGVPFPGLEAKLFFSTLEGITHHYLLFPAFPFDDIANLLLLKYRK